MDTLIRSLHLKRRMPHNFLEESTNYLSEAARHLKYTEVWPAVQGVQANTMIVLPHTTFSQPSRRSEGEPVSSWRKGAGWIGAQEDYLVANRISTE
jgi:hypothetical protein